MKKIKLASAIADVPTTTNVIYPASVLKKAVEDYNKNAIKAISYIGSSGQCLDDYVGKIEKAKFEDGIVTVDISLFDTERGKTIQAMFDAGFPFFASISGYVDFYEKNGNRIIKDIKSPDFKLSGASWYGQQTKIVDSFLDEDQKIVETFSEE